MGYFKLRAVFYIADLSTSLVIFGYSIGLLNAVGDLVSDELSWGSNKAYYFSMCQGGLAIGSIFGSFVAGIISIKYGKRKTLIGVGVLNIIGVLMFSFGNTLIKVIGRFINGLCNGFFFSVPQNFLSEVLPLSIRKFASIYTSASYGLGYLISCILALGLPLEYSYNDPMAFWVLFMSLFPILFMLFQTFGLIFYLKHETPVWLLDNGKEKEYQEALKFMYDDEGFLASKLEIEGRKEIMNSEKPSLLEIFTDKKYLKMTIMSSLLMLFHQCTGFNNLLYYSSRIFRDITNDIFLSRLFSICVGLTVTISTLMSSLITRGFGRKNLLTCSFCTVATLNLVIGIVSNYIEDPAFIVLPLIIAFIFVSSSSVGTVVILYCMESLNIQIFAFASTCNALVNTLIVVVFPMVRKIVEIYDIFYFFAGMGFAATAYTGFYLIETKGLDKKQIAEAFLRKVRQK